MILEEVKEMWQEIPKSRETTADGKLIRSIPIIKEIHRSKMFLRGDDVILILKNLNLKSTETE